jgi:alpha-amylase
MIPISTEPNYGKLRGFEGGDIKESQKNWRRLFWQIRINAIWFTPIVEQIHDRRWRYRLKLSFHGIKRLTALDPNFGTKADLAN